MNPEESKQKELANWTRVAGGWAKHTPMIGTLFGPVTERMFELAGLRERHKVLDLACGAGDPAIPAAQRVGRFGRVVGIDFVPGMVESAQQRARDLGLTNIEFQLADAENLQLPDSIFDVCSMRWGLMFMPEPEKCLATARAALKETGRLVLSCWAGPERNPWAAIPLAVFKRYIEVPQPPPGATGIFAFADPERIRAVMQAAGFRDIQIEAFELRAADSASGADFFTLVREIAGPLAALHERVPAADRERLAADVARAAEEASQIKGRVVLPGVTWIASAST